MNVVQFLTPDIRKKSCLCSWLRKFTEWRSLSRCQCEWKVTTDSLKMTQRKRSLETRQTRGKNSQSASTNPRCRDRSGRGRRAGQLLIGCYSKDGLMCWPSIILFIHSFALHLVRHTAMFVRTSTIVLVLSVRLMATCRHDFDIDIP